MVPTKARRSQQLRTVDKTVSSREGVLVSDRVPGSEVQASGTVSNVPQPPFTHL